MTILIAPPPALNVAVTAEELTQLVDEAIVQERETNDKIAALDPQEQTFETIVPMLTKTENAISGILSLVSGFSLFAPEPELRDAAVKMEKKYKDFHIEQSTRYDCYQVIQNMIEKTDKIHLGNEQARFLDRLVRKFRENGLNLPEEERVEFKQHLKRLNEVTLEYMKNWSSENSTIKFTKDELRGMNVDYLNNLKTEMEDDVTKYVLTMKLPDYRPVMRLCNVESTRKAYLIAYESRNKENIPLIDEAIKIRRKCAKILGYETHADFALEKNMAKNPKLVFDLLDDLTGKLRAPGLKDVEILRKLKQDDKASLNEDFDGAIHAWDLNYYERILLENEYSVNQEEIKDYFSLEPTVKNMLSIYETVLGLKFIGVSSEKAVVWHPDVQLFECWDTAEDKRFMGYLYLDLFPREKKFPHAACFALQSTYLKEDGTKVAPMAAMVANFIKPTADMPSLMKHEELVTLFHELGHAMHNLCSFTEYAQFHGTSVEGDFVETPSRMLENWCYDFKSLKRLSAHYKTGKPLPDDIIASIVKSRKALQALQNLRSLQFSLFDMVIHTTDDNELDTTKTFNEIRERVSLLPVPEGTCAQAAFVHIMGGYDAAYYGYLWSTVSACDMFYNKFQKNTLSSEAGYAYRKLVLEKGGSKDGMDLLIDFLGREPSSDAFMREYIGVV